VRLSNNFYIGICLIGWLLGSAIPYLNVEKVDLISDALPFGQLWYDTPDNAIGYAMHYSRSADAVIRVYDVAGNVIETHEHKGDFKEC
jgi:hypothetical protein